MAVRSLVSMRAIPLMMGHQMLQNNVSKAILPLHTEAMENFSRHMLSVQPTLNAYPMQLDQERLSFAVPPMKPYRPSFNVQAILDKAEKSPAGHGEGGLSASSTLKKRRLKMNKHKYRKRRKKNRKKTKET